MVPMSPNVSRAEVEKGIREASEYNDRVLLTCNLRQSNCAFFKEAMYPDTNPGLFTQFETLLTKEAVEGLVYGEKSLTYTNGPHEVTIDYDGILRIASVTISSSKNEPIGYLNHWRRDDA